MIRNLSAAAFATFAILTWSVPANAATLTVGAGSAVGAADAVATFTGIDPGLLVYQEAGLLFSTDEPTISIPFDAFGRGVAEIGIHYAGGARGTGIRPASLPLIYAIEFIYGDGNTGFGCCRGGMTPSRLDWVARRAGAEVGSGSLLATVGTTVGIVDAHGFDQLLLRADRPEFNRNSIALDNVAVAFSASAIAPAPAPVPLPASALLFAGGFVALWSARRRG